MRTRAYRHQLSGSGLEQGAVQLQVDDVNLRFGGVTALAGIDMAVHQGDIHAVIGPNGAGKTSLLNCISGLYRPQGGRILLHTGDKTVNLTKTRPSRIASYGVARSFQNIELFKHMTVLQNLMLGRHVHLSHSVWRSLLWFGPARTQEIEHRDLVEEIIDRLEIQALRKQPVGALAYGLQKRVELGRALSMQPSLLLLDEPMAGMNAEEKEDMARFILDMHDLSGVTIILIEHDMGVVMDVSDRVTVLDFGRRIADGPPDVVSRDEHVIQAYLGESSAA